jgi:hypothetical protein
MKLFNWINPLWIMDNFLTTRFDPVTATAAATAAAAAAPTAATVLPAVAAPSILGGGLTGAGMMTAGSPIIPGLLASSTPGLMGGLGTLGGTAMGATGAASALNPSVPTTFMNQNISPLLTNEATRNAASFNPSQFATQGFSDGVMNQYAPNFADIARGTSEGFTGGGYAGSFLDNIGGSAMDALKANPFQAAGLGLNIYDRMNASQAPLQPSATLRSQQLMGQQMPSITPQFNSTLQLPRRPILIG